MDEVPGSFLKENWFKVGVLLVLLVVSYSFYHTLVIRPEQEKTEREKVHLDATLKESEKIRAEGARREENKNNLESCLNDAQKSYSSGWIRECKSQGNLSERCEALRLKTLDIGAAFKKYKEWYPKATFDDFSSFYDECSCRLPEYNADTLNGYLKNDKDLCFKKYPQQ